MKISRVLMDKHTNKQVAIPALLALLMAAVLVTLLLSWSAARTDSISFERQEQLVSHVLSQSVNKIAREQEGLSLKDNAVHVLTHPIVTQADIKRVDGNWGPFLHTYYRHDESYILRGDDTAFYAMRDGKVVSPSEFDAVRAAARPVVAQLRAETRRIPIGTPLTKSPGAHDFAVVHGHPAILSAKPVISPTGKEVQTPGREVVHISILYLDGHFLRELAENYRFDGARFARLDDRRSDEAALPFISPRTHGIIGYFIWQPYAPGSIVMKDMIPPLVAALLLIGLVVGLLLLRIARRTVQLEASEAHAKHLAFHDILTGLPNRALFEDRLDKALANARRHPDRNVALLYLDLDRFKKVNDTLGHPAGDELIRELGRRLSKVVRDADTVARLGGDEFAIILSDVKSRRDIDRLCNRIITVVNEPFDLIGSQAFVGVSIGVARAVQDSFDRTELARKADIALYNAKASGRGRATIFQSAMDATIQIRQAIEQDLRVALERGGELQVDYQPVYGAASKKASAVEALVRWNHPQHGAMAPATFVPIAEESGLIDQLGEWVLREACSAAVAWPVETVCVNLSPVQLRDSRFAQRALAILHETGFDPHRLELEITETSFVENADECAPNINALRAAGVRIALDDFGTGYSSFSHLLDFKVDRVKIDRSFVMDIGSSTEPGSPIIQAIVGLAQRAGLKITAEGVENADQDQYLRAVGCDDLQGFFLSKPILRAEADRMFGIPAKDNVIPLPANRMPRKPESREKTTVLDVARNR